MRSTNWERFRGPWHKKVLVSFQFVLPSRKSRKQVLLVRHFWKRVAKSFSPGQAPKNNFPCDKPLKNQLLCDTLPKPSYMWHVTKPFSVRQVIKDTKIKETSHFSGWIWSSKKKYKPKSKPTSQYFSSLKLELERNFEKNARKRCAYLDTKILLSHFSFSCVVTLTNFPSKNVNRSTEFVALVLKKQLAKIYTYP